jgi:endonuclease/exonuclease/phosphatase family metal-dependent hydrolase
MRAIRVASYNIHRCFGIDGKYSAERIREVLKQLDAQVIALQEVESGIQHAALLEYLTQDGPWRFVDGSTMQHKTARYGNAVLTSLPILETYKLDLSYTDREPRGAIDLRLATANPDGILRIIATHLGLQPAERREQTRKLLDWIGPPGKDSADITVLLGDLNEWFLWGRPLKWLRAYFGTSPSPSTFPTRWPIFSLDRIWVCPSQRLHSIEVNRSGLARLASDHYPLVATLT